MTDVQKTPRQEYEEAVALAEARVQRAQSARRQAEDEDREAIRQRDRYAVEHQLRTPLAHAGLDRALAGAENLMRRKLLDARGALCRDAGIDSPDTVLDLAALHVLTTPEFAEHLHRLLDEPTPANAAPMHDMSDEEYAAGLEPLKARIAETNERVQAAREEHTDATQALLRVR